MPSAEKRATSVQPYFGSRLAADGGEERLRERGVEARAGALGEVDDGDLEAGEHLAQVRDRLRAGAARARSGS